MRKLLAALICLLLLTPATAQKTKTQLNTEVTTNLPDNTVGAITPALVRTTLLDMIASWVDLNGTGGFNCSTNTFVNAFSNLSTPSCVQPTFSNLSGNIAVSQMNSGTGASATTVWRGDGTWGTVSGVGTVTEQKNTAGVGLTTSGNCDNTSSNVGSPCQHNVALTSLSNSLAAPVSLNNITLYFTGPQVAQGTAGTWFASGTVSLIDSSPGGSNFSCKLWDGTTVAASVFSTSAAANYAISVSLSGILSNPAANIRISCSDPTAVTGQILFNGSGNSKDSTLTVLRMQ